MKHFFKRVLCLLLVLASVLSILPQPAVATEIITFIDVPSNAWYYDAVYTVANQYGLMNGFGDGTFKPESSLTREQFVKVLAVISGADVQAYADVNIRATFTDVPNGQWYSPYIAWAYENQITGGISATEFGVNKPVTREQVAKFLVSFMEKYDYRMTPADEYVYYADSEKISNWAVDYVETIRTTGLFRGDDNGCFNPLNAISRAEIATVLVRLMALLEDSMDDVYYLSGIRADTKNGVITVSGCAGRNALLQVEVLSEDERTRLACTQTRIFTACHLKDMQVKVDASVFPTYYVLRARIYSLDGEPLTNPYVNLHATRAYEAFDSKTVEDFEEELVINLDSNPNDNFIVLAEGTQNLLDQADLKVISADEEAGVYKLSGSGLDKLQAGDRIVVRIHDKVSYIKVREITCKDGIYTITEEQDTKLDDFLQYIRMDLSTLVTEPTKSDPASPDDFSLSFGTLSNSITLGLAAIDGSLSGDIFIHCVLEFDARFWKDEAYFLLEYWEDFHFSASATIKLEGDGTGADEIELIPFYKCGLSAFPEAVKDIVQFDFDVGLVLSFQASGGVTAHASGIIRSGIIIDSRNADQKIRDVKDKSGTVTPEARVEARITLGPRAIGSFKLGEFVHAYAEFIVGGELNLELSDALGESASNAPSYHACERCLAGDTGLVFRFDLACGIKTKVFEFEKKISEETPLLFKKILYISVKNDPRSIHGGKAAMGEGPCPNHIFRVRYKVIDGNGKAVSTPVTAPTKDGGSTQIPSGKHNYLYPGEYVASAMVEDEVVSKDFKVTTGAVEVLLKGTYVDLLVRVIDQDGKEISNPDLTLQGKGEVHGKGTIQQAGKTYRGFRVPKGSWTIIATADKYTKKTVAKNITADTTLTIQLEKMDWLYAYVEALGGMDEKYCRFTLAYIDDNAIPELIISPHGSHVAAASIYTYYNGKLVELGNYGDYGTTHYSKRNGMIHACAWINGYGIYEIFYKLKDGSTTKLKFFKTQFATGAGSDTYYVDNVAVSKSTYERQYDAIYDAYHWTTFDYGKGFQNSTANRNAMLEDYTKFFID